MRVVQGQMGLVVADNTDRPDQSGNRSGPRRRQTRVRRDDGDEKDRHRCHRGGAPRLKAKVVLRCSTSRVAAKYTSQGRRPRDLS